MKILQVCPPHLSDVATLPWEIQKSHCQQYTVNSQHLRRKKTAIHLPTPPENVTTLTCELQKLFHLTEGVAFFQTLKALMKRTSYWLSSVALKRTGCDVWQLECQASSVTASVQSDHLLR